MLIDSGRVLILILSPVKNTEKRVQAMESILPQNVNVIKTIMERDVNIGMSARQIKIVAYRENVLMLEELHCPESSATATLDGLAQLAIKVI